MSLEPAAGPAGPQDPSEGAREGFRDFGGSAPPRVAALYRENHARQTLAFVQAKKAEYLPLRRARLGVWEAFAALDRIVDESDPDLDATQLDHALQTAEALRRDGRPRALVLVGLVHDLGKVLCLFGEPQWAVVGDTFPVGCRYSDRIVFPEFFADNPDSKVAEYQTPCGIYEEGCGLDKVHLSWGHDEYLYHVVKDYLPEEGLAMIRYHSFYAGHREGQYTHLMNDRDHELMNWVRAFNPYDLYSKGHVRPDVAALTPYYRDLIDEFFPATLAW